MLRTRRLTASLVSLLVAVTFGVFGAAPSATAYVPGSSTANVGRSGDYVVWSCNWGGWAGVTKNWSCRFWNPSTGTTYQKETGSTVAGGWRTSSHYYLKNGRMCVTAWAAYTADGNSDIDTKCGG